jgi:hypothetical protein
MRSSESLKFYRSFLAEVNWPIPITSLSTFGRVILSVGEGSLFVILERSEGSCLIVILSVSEGSCLFVILRVAKDLALSSS